MFNFPSNKYCYSNTYFQGSVEVIFLRLGFKVIKDFGTSPHFEEARKWFNYESGKSREFQKKIIGLKCHQTFRQSVTIFHDDRIDFNEHRNVFKDIKEVPPSEDWFPYEYIDTDVNNS